MDAQIKEQWIKALRSGKYRQGVGALHRSVPGEGDKFCCLGVLCDLAVKEGEISRPSESSAVQGLRAYDDASGVLPASVSAWAGMPGNDNGAYGPHDGADTPTKALSDDNDSGKTFFEIANIIEENF